MVKFRLALALAITTIAAATGWIESSVAQSNPNLDCSYYRGESTC